MCAGAAGSRGAFGTGCAAAAGAGERPGEAPRPCGAPGTAALVQGRGEGSWQSSVAVGPLGPPREVTLPLRPRSTAALAHAPGVTHPQGGGVRGVRVPGRRGKRSGHGGDTAPSHPPTRDAPGRRGCPQLAGASCRTVAVGLDLALPYPVFRFPECSPEVPAGCHPPGTTPVELSSCGNGGSPAHCPSQLTAGWVMVCPSEELGLKVPFVWWVLSAALKELNHMDPGSQCHRTLVPGSACCWWAPSIIHVPVASFLLEETAGPLEALIPEIRQGPFLLSSPNSFTLWGQVGDALRQVGTQQQQTAPENRHLGAWRKRRRSACVTLPHPTSLRSVPHCCPHPPGHHCQLQLLAGGLLQHSHRELELSGSSMGASRGPLLLLRDSSLSTGCRELQGGQHSLASPSHPLCPHEHCWDVEEPQSCHSIRASCSRAA